MISTTAMTNAISKEQIKDFMINSSVEKMKDILSFFVWLYIFGGVGLYLDKLEAIFIPEVKNYAIGRILLFYVYLTIMMVLNAYTFPIIYNIPEYKRDLLNWQLDLYDHVKSLFTIEKNDAFHKKLQQFTKNKELSSKNHHGFDGFDVIDDLYEDVSSSEEDDDGSQVWDTKDPMEYGYDKKGNYVKFEDSDDFEEDKHGNWCIIE